MIDTWSLAAVCLTLLTAGALVRVLRATKRHDRYLAAMVAVTAGSASGLVLSIALGTLVILDMTIIVALLCFAGIIAHVQFSGGAGA